MNITLRVLVPALFACAIASADVITLKDGRVLEGEVIEESDTSVKLKMKKGAITIKKGDIATHDRKLTPAQEYVEKLKALDRKSADAWLKLAAWAAGKELEAEAIDAWLKGWELDKTSATAKQELEKRDYHLEDGRWKTGDEYWPSRGYKKLGSKWYAPLEYDFRVAQREAEKKDSERKAAEAALEAAHGKVKGADRKSAAENGKIEVARRGIEGANDDLRDANVKVNDASRAQSLAAADSDLSSSDVGKKQKAQAALDVAKQKVARLQKAADAIQNKINRLNMDIEAAQIAIANIAEDRRRSGEELPALEAEVTRAAAAATEEQNRANEAKAAWENSK